MTTTVTGTSDTLTWEETTWEGKPHDQVSGAKLTRAHVTTAWHGDVEGESTQEWLMTYASDVYADFVGVEHVTATIDGRSGAFAILHRGTFQDGIVRSAWSVAPGSGTDGLKGLSGEGTYLWDGQPPTRYTFDYAFADPDSA